jgi:hypothetical protein
MPAKFLLYCDHRNFDLSINHQFLISSQVVATFNQFPEYISSVLITSCFITHTLLSRYERCRTEIAKAGPLLKFGWDFTDINYSLQAWAVSEHRQSRRHVFWIVYMVRST